MAIYSSQPTGGAGDSCRISSLNPNNNYGDNTRLDIGEDKDTANSIWRGVMKFDLTSIPTGSTITAATLSLWLWENKANNTRIAYVYRLKRAWLEGQVTWNQWITGQNWQFGGADGVNDRDGTPSGSRSIAFNEAFGEKQWELDEGVGDYSRIEAMIGNSPSFDNNGWIVKVATEVNDMHRYWPDEGGPLGNEPKLYIVYTPPPVLISGLPIWF